MDGDVDPGRQRQSRLWPFALEDRRRRSTAASAGAPVPLLGRILLHQDPDQFRLRGEQSPYASAPLSRR